MGLPQLYFGGSGIGKGNFASPEQVKELLQYLASNGVKSVDTAAVYPLGAPYGSETVLGQSGLANGAILADSKIALNPDFTSDGTLTKAKIDDSVNGSFKRLNGKIHILYCHMPDSKTPLAETVSALHDQLKSGHFDKLGLCNYTVELIEEFLKSCNEADGVKPKVFQSVYNALTRGDEEKLLPFLRQHGIGYVAVSPLAAGFLSGRLTFGGDLSGTRFEEGNFEGQLVRGTYDKPPMHAAVKKLEAAFAPFGISVPEAALRWLYYHSKLGENDAIVLGASSMQQLRANLESVSKGPLDESQVSIFDDIQETVKGDA